MTDDPHAARAAALVADPSRYEEFAMEYADDVTFYSELRNSAQESLDTFTEYLELRRIFLKRGPAEAVRERLTERLDRSLKNMILETSASGRAYPIATLQAAADRLDRFADLGVETPSLLSVVKTTLEHLYDGGADAARCHDLLDRLLSDTPAADGAATAYVARARLGEALRLADAPVRHSTQALSAYCGAVEDPAPDDRRPAEALVDEARERSFADEEKERLYAVALHRGPSVRVPFDYLYVVAHEVVESYRHAGGDPRRADLLIAQRHLALLADLDVPGWDEQRATRVRAYRHVTEAIQRGGGQWLSDRASAPDPEWGVVAYQYGRAAETVRMVDQVRAVKYLSKAFRHAAHATEAWQTQQRIHRTAQQAFRSMTPAESDAISEAIDGTVQVHRCRAAEAHAHVAFADGAYQDAAEAAEEAVRLAETVPQRSLRLDGVDFIREFSAGRNAERAGDYEEARRRYAAVADDSDWAAGRRDLIGVKRALADEEYADALATAETQFGTGSLVFTATQAAAGIVPGDTGGVAPAVEFKHATVAVTTLEALLRIYSADGAGGAAVSDQIRRQLLAL